MKERLSPRMKAAIEELNQNGRYRETVLLDWAFWVPLSDQCGRHIRTDTRKALIKRGIVKTWHENKTWYAEKITAL